MSSIKKKKIIIEVIKEMRCRWGVNEFQPSTCYLGFLGFELPLKTSVACLHIHIWYIERERERLIWSLKTGYFWGTESLQKRRWASVAVPPRRKCSTNANGCWENVYALTFHPPIPPRRQANRPSQQSLGIHLLSSTSISHKQWTKAIFFNKFLLVFGSIGY